MKKRQSKSPSKLEMKDRLNFEAELKLNFVITLTQKGNAQHDIICFPTHNS